MINVGQSNRKITKIVAGSLMLLTIFLIFIRLFFSGLGTYGRWNQWDYARDPNTGSVIEDGGYQSAGFDMLYVILLFFSYFGVVITTITALWFFVLAFFDKTNVHTNKFTKYTSGLAITVWNLTSMVVFLFILLPTSVKDGSFDGTNMDPSWWISNLILYVVIPLFTFVFFAFYYEGRTNMKLVDVFKIKQIMSILLLPIIYFALISAKSYLLYSTYVSEYADKYANIISLWVYPFLNFNQTTMGLNSGIIFAIVIIIALVSLMGLSTGLLALTLKVDGKKFNNEAYKVEETEFNNSKSLMTLKDFKTTKHYFKLVVALASAAMLVLALYSSYASANGDEGNRYNKFVLFNEGDENPIRIGGDLITSWNFALGMFTFQSNLLVSAWFIVAFIKGGNEHKGKFTNYQWSLAISGYITVTFIIFNCLMLPTIHTAGTVDGNQATLSWWIVNILLHTVFPLCMIFYFVFWYKKENFGTTKELFSKRRVIAIISYPIFYALFILVRGEILFASWGQNYWYSKGAWLWPYPFLNVRNSGWLGLPGWGALIFAVGLISSILIGTSSLYNWSVNKLELKANNKVEKQPKKVIKKDTKKAANK
ncbi:Pr6Pr family membrane protein [Spiroplasma culicicola]|uniref:Transmembrane protein n=1 Tax=Spiroplasma culicicola AES-1 TaxID=1276246 RepID=W6A6U7_9MOLU|nr:hypothetical protein [Spiroplasma culicicola]AHI52605.1 hypothetical protein SCULI_v1c02640 [Spiroplasma culicicola AES-1]